MSLLGNHRGGRGRGGFGPRTQDRKYQNGYGPHRHPLPGPQFYQPNPFGYPGPQQNQHAHPANTPVFYNSPYQQGYGHPPRAHPPYNGNFPAGQSLANQTPNSGTPWQGFEWEALNGPHHPFSRERYSQSFPQVDTLPYPHHRLPINGVTDPSRLKTPTRRPHLDNLYEDDVHLDYMDCNFGEPSFDPRGLPRHNTNIGTQPQTKPPRTEHITTTTSKNPSSAKSPHNYLSAAAPPIPLKAPSAKPGQQPIDRVMVLRRRQDAPRMSNTTSSNNNRLYNHQLDFTPSLLSNPPAEYLLDATFWKIDARDAARKAGVTQGKQTATDDQKAPQIPDSDQDLARVKDEASCPPTAGFPKRPRPTSDEKRPLPPTLVEAAVDSRITVGPAPEKPPCSERKPSHGPQSHGPPTRNAGVVRTSCGDATSSEDGMLLDGADATDGLSVMDTGVYESERWGGGRMIPSGLDVARRRDEGAGLSTTRFSSHRATNKPSAPSVDVPASNVPQPEGMQKLASPCTSDSATAPLLPPRPTNVSPGARGLPKGYVLAEDCAQTGKGKLLLLDAPPALLPQRSTRSGKVFKPPGSGSSSDQATEAEGSEEEQAVNRRHRPRGAARKRVLLSEHSDE